MFLQIYYLQLFHQSKFPSIVCCESSHCLLAFFILVFAQFICWAFQGPLVSPSVQQVYLYLLCPRASLFSRLKPCKNSLLSQCTLGYLSNHSLLFTQLVYRGKHSRSGKLPGGPMSPFFPGGPPLPKFPRGPLFPRDPGGPGNPRFPLSPLFPLRPCLPSPQNTVGVVVLDGADLTQLPGRPGRPGIPDGPRSP